MDVHKLRIRIGAAELEAEGPQDWVEKQRDMFLTRLEGDSADENANEHGSRSEGSNSERTERAVIRPVSETDINRIASQSGDVITLTAVPGGETADEDSFMLLLLAHKVMRGVDSVLAGDLLAGMKQSGRAVDRLDGVFAKIDSTHVIRTGVRKGTKYRLTSPGGAKAKGLAHQLLATVGY